MHPSARCPASTHPSASARCLCDDLIVMEMWAEVAKRVTAAFDLPPSALVVLRDRCGRREVIDAVVITFERQGVTTVIDPASDHVLDAVLSTTSPSLLANWGCSRSAALELADAVVTLGGGPLPTDRASQSALRALRAGRADMEEVEARRALPYLSVAVPTPLLAAELGQSVAELDRAVLDALATSLEVIRALIDTQLARATRDPLVLRTAGCSLTMRRGDRPWLDDDGHISDEDRARGAVASTLPCGTIYTTVLEDSAEGTVRLPQFAQGQDVVLTFHNGIVVDAQGTGAESVLPWLAEFGPDAARISHIGIGLNAACTGHTGWAIVNEQRSGSVLVAFGENRYMGGTNASTLNYDVVLDTATLLAGETPLVENGQLER